MSWPRIIQVLPPCLCLNRHRRNMVLLEVLALYSSKRHKNTIVPYSNRYPLPITNTSKPKIPKTPQRQLCNIAIVHRIVPGWDGEQCNFQNNEKFSAKKI